MRRALLPCALVALGACECAGPTVTDPPPVDPPINTDPLTTALQSEVRRLSQEELDNTVRDLLLDETRPASRLLLTDTFTPYDNNYVEQQSSAALVDALEALATDVAVRALANPEARARIISCTPAARDDAQCFRQVIVENGRRLLRRPLEPAEIDAYAELITFANGDAGNEQFYTTSFDDAVEVLLRALLMDPELLFRIEAGTPLAEPGVVRLNSYELATRMSYLLWGSAPDDALLADAEAGRLENDAARRAVAERMLEDPRARTRLQRFHALWLGYRAIPHPPELSQRFARETGALIDRVVFDERRDYLDLFRFEETFVDDFLADHYGLQRPEQSPGWVSYEGTDRAGILSQGAVLSAFSKFTDTSPTQRGILVRNRLLCEQIQPPPPDVMVDEPPPPTQDAYCKLDRYRAHTQVASCNNCHSLMDPIGFGLEQYDIAGRFRSFTDDDPTCEVDGTGDLPGFGTFRGPKQLAQLLADDGVLEACFMKQLHQYSQGRPTDGDEPVIDAWARRFRDNDRDLQALLLEQIESVQFATKREVRQ